MVSDGLKYTSFGSVKVTSMKESVSGVSSGVTWDDEGGRGVNSDDDKEWVVLSETP